MGLFDSLSPGRQTPFRWSKAALRLVLSLGVFALVFWLADLEWSTIVLGIERVGLGHWFSALAAFLVLHAIGALKWRLFLGMAGARITRFEALRFYAAGLFSNLCLPSLVGGDAVRAGLAMTRAESKAAVLLGGAADRMSDLVALGLLVGLGCVLAPDALARMETAEQPVDPLVIVGTFFGLMLLGVGGVLLVLRLRPPSTWPPKLRQKGESILRALAALRGAPKRATLGLSLCFGIQFSFVAINAYLGGVMEVGLDYALWYLLWPLAKIAAMMPFSLGGIGVREAALAILVTPFGEDVKNMAVAQSLVWQTVLVAGGIVAGALWVVSSRVRGGNDGATHARPDRATS